MGFSRDESHQSTTQIVEQGKWLMGKHVARPDEDEPSV